MHLCRYWYRHYYWYSTIALLQSISLFLGWIWMIVKWIKIVWKRYGILQQDLIFWKDSGIQKKIRNYSRIYRYSEINIPNSYTLCFVAGKSRVAPGKSSMTILHLELCAAVIAAKLAHQIEQEHRWVFLCIVFWTVVFCGTALFELHKVVLQSVCC